MAKNGPKRSAQENDAYWISLGRFVQSYSTAETMMQELLWQKAEVTSDTARAVFSGVRIKEAISFVRRIHEARGIPGYDIIEPAMKQLGHITDARNDILHYGAKFVEGKPSYVTTKRAAHVPDRARQFPVSEKILNQMIADLAVIMTQVEMFRQQGNALDQTFREVIQNTWPEPWQYKPSPQADSQRKSSGDPARKDLPPSSQE